MCGIIGYLEPLEAMSILLDGLKRLESFVHLQVVVLLLAFMPESEGGG
jgi:hypothetical protein